MNINEKYNALVLEQEKAEKALNPFVAAGHAKTASRIAIELLGFLLECGGHRG